MEEDPEFNLEIVKEFMVSRLGKVTNHELVSHFKPYLSHSEKKAINREKFKDFVNTLASVKEEDGEKVLVLKKKYRKGTSLAPDPKKKKKGGATASETEISETDSPSPAPPPHSPLPPPHSPAPLPLSPSPSTSSLPTKEEESRLAQGYKPEESISIPDDSIHFQNRGQSSNVEPEIEKKDLRPPSVVLTKPSVSDEDDGGGRRRGAGGDGPQTTVVLETPGESSTDPPDEVFQGEDSPDGRAQKGELVEGKPPHSPTGMSVKERAKHLNKMESDSNLHSSGVKMRKHNHGDKRDDDSSSVSSGGYVPMDELDREWMVVSAAADYHPMHKLLNQKPELAKKRDFITSALHWAAKHGKSDVIKLLCGQQSINVNARSGYTPLHLAAMNGHEDIIELLVHGYSAEPNLRDYSGKKAKQYLRNSASSRTQQILQNRRPTSNPTGNFKRSGSYSAKIHKSGYFGIHGMSATIRNSWMGGAENGGGGGGGGGVHSSPVSRSPSMSPSPSPRESPSPSPRNQRKSSKLGIPPPPPRPPPPVRPPRPPPRRRKSLQGTPPGDVQNQKSAKTEVKKPRNVEPTIEPTEVQTTKSEPPSVNGHIQPPNADNLYQNPIPMIQEEESDKANLSQSPPKVLESTKTAENHQDDFESNENDPKHDFEDNSKLSQTVGYYGMIDCDQEVPENGQEMEEKDEIDDSEIVVPADSNLDVRASLGVFGDYIAEQEEIEKHEEEDHNAPKEDEKDEECEKNEPKEEIDDFSGISLIERLVSASARVYYGNQKEFNDEIGEFDESNIHHQKDLEEQNEAVYDPEVMEFNPFFFGQDMLQRQVSESIPEEEEEEEDNVIDYNFTEPYFGHATDFSPGNVMKNENTDDGTIDAATIGDGYSENWYDEGKEGETAMEGRGAMMMGQDFEEEQEEEMLLVAPPRRRKKVQPIIDTTPVVPPRRRRSQKSQSTEASDAKFSTKDLELMPPPSAPSRKKKSRHDDKENSIPGMPRPQSEPNMTLTRAVSNPDMTSEARHQAPPVVTSPFV